MDVRHLEVLFLLRDNLLVSHHLYDLTLNTLIISVIRGSSKANDFLCITFGSFPERGHILENNIITFINNEDTFILGLNILDVTDVIQSLFAFQISML